MRSRGCCSMRACKQRFAAGLAIATTLTVGAAAHPLDEAMTPDGLWRSWSLEPGVLLALGALAAVYAIGVARLRRAPGGRAVVGRRHVVAFVAGWVITAVALVSPLDRMGSALFSAHMVQHELLMIVAAPLLVAGV